MRKGLMIIAAIATLSIAGVANADEASGKIEAMDLQSRTILLDDGNAYLVGEGVAIESLQPGTEVTVSYEEKGGQKVATDVKPDS